MAITEIITYETEDGKTFHDKEDAIRHEQECDAEERLLALFTDANKDPGETQRFAVKMILAHRDDVFIILKQLNE